MKLLEDTVEHKVYLWWCLWFPRISGATFGVGGVDSGTKIATVRASHSSYNPVWNFGFPTVGSKWLFRLVVILI